MVSVQIAALVVALSSSGETALLDFHAPWCAPCRAMEGTIAELARAGYPIRKVNIDEDRRLASQYNVHSVPCFVLVVDGRETARLSGAVGRHELEAMLERGGVRRGAGQRKITRAQSPDPPGRGASSPAPRGNRFAPSLLAAAGTARDAEPAGASATGAGQDLIRASVRLTISDPGGSSYGSGTLIDARQGEALVLTCGHIFRDSQGQGRISVDLCESGAPQKLSGRLVSYDLQCDVALVSIRPGVPVRVAPLAPKSYRIAKGDRVITVGCNHGGAATAQASSITAVNKFRAPPNLSVAGLPVQGRSGGGLFTADGQVIGVCNAADPSDDEGLYAALAAIQDELDEAGLTAIYENGPPPGAGTTVAVAERGRMPAPAESSFPADRATQVMPANLDARSGITPEALAEISDRADGAEVICIVRSLSNPDARSEVIMLDRASSEFLHQLSADRRAQEARHLTSLEIRAKSRPQPRPRR